MNKKKPKKKASLPSTNGNKEEWFSWMFGQSQVTSLLRKKTKLILSQCLKTTIKVQTQIWFVATKITQKTPLWTPNSLNEFQLSNLYIFSIIVYISLH